MVRRTRVLLVFFCLYALELGPSILKPDLDLKEKEEAVCKETCV
jgi:hypothetical protein